MSLRTSIRDSHLLLKKKANEPSLTHPTFSISKQEEDIVTSVSLSKEHPVYFKEFFILHRETGKRYTFETIVSQTDTFSFRFNLIAFIHQVLSTGERAHFEFYFEISYFIDGEWIEKQEPLSLDLFDYFDSYGITQFKDREDYIYPYISRKTNGFCFTVNIPVRSIRYIQDSHITQIKTKKHKIAISGEIVSKAIAINRIDTVMVGRKSGLTHVIHSNHMLEELEAETHLYRYGYDLLIDVKDFAMELLLDDLADEEFDLYFDVYLNGLFDPTVVRVANPEKMHSQKIYKHTYFSYGNTTFAFSPKFSTQYQGLSICSTRFEKEVFDYFKELLWTFWFIRPFYLRRKIWIVGEKPTQASSNGFDFYRYLRQQHPEKEVYYVIDPASDAYQKLQPFGEDHLLKYKSKEYIWHLLMSETLLTAFAPYDIYPTRTKPLLNFVRAKKVYLQNGIVGLQDETKTLGRGSLQFETDLFLVSSKNEKRLVQDVLGYTDKEVAITGLSRYDRLFDNKETPEMKQQLLFYPIDHETGLHFQTEFIDVLAKNYLALIASTDMQEFLARHKLEFVIALPHAFETYVTEFEALNCTVRLQRMDDPMTLIKESKLMITDYASEAFDFSFLTKPVVFYQFENNFYQQKDSLQLQQAYQNELPGEVTVNADDLICILERIASDNFKMSKGNQQKANLLIEHKDTASNERIFEAVTHLKKGMPFL